MKRRKARGLTIYRSSARRRGHWRVDLIALKREIEAGSLSETHRKFIERVLPGFCDFAAGKIDRWPPAAARNPKEVA
jgi:hypothetical protein